MTDLPLRAQGRSAARAMQQRNVESSMTGALRRPDVLRGEQFPAPPTQKRSRRARELLLAAALSRFAEHGYEATTVEDITKQAGVAVGAFYLHFRSKRQVLLVLMDHLLQEVEDRPLTGDEEGVMTSFIERLRARLQMDWSYAGAYRAWREAALRDADLAALHAEIEAWTATRMARALRTAAAARKMRLPIDVAAFSWILSVVIWRTLEAPVSDRPLVADTIVAFVQHILYDDDGLRRAQQDGTSPDLASAAVDANR